MYICQAQDKFGYVMSQARYLNFVSAVVEQVAGGCIRFFPYYRS